MDTCWMNGCDDPHIEGSDFCEKHNREAIALIDQDYSNTVTTAIQQMFAQETKKDDK